VTTASPHTVNGTIMALYSDRRSPKWSEREGGREREREGGEGERGRERKR